MEHHELRLWYKQVALFMYILFSLWTVAFLLYGDETEHKLHYIAIFTQLGASVVASALLVSDRRMFVPILLILMIPLILYFGLIGTWYGYVLSLFSTIFLGVLLYASNNTYKLLETNYYNAQHDVLTGLYNRRSFIEYTNDLVERLKYTQKNAFIILVDLDHFKNINDSLGHEIGDRVLQEVAERLTTFCRLSDMVARLGGDEFVVISKEFSQVEASNSQIYAYVKMLLEKLKEPYIIDHHHLYISASIGINQIEVSKFVDVSEFLKEADIAMYEAKESGRNGIVLFNDALAKRVEAKLDIEQRLHYALENNTLDVYFQPQVDNQQKVIGCEALLRWEDDKLGVISPKQFIPIAENTGLIIEVGHYVLKKAFQALQAWEESGIKIEQISINISVRQLFYSTFVEDVRKLIEIYLDENSIKKVIFEITESVLAEDMNKVIKILTELKTLGISFSMDDFGTGYSSLNYLRTLPVDELKIDQTFIEHMLESGADRMMVTTIISIARNFGLKVVIEGVETKSQFNFLSNYHCYAYQGFYFSKALNKDAFEALYRTTLHTRR